MATHYTFNPESNVHHEQYKLGFMAAVEIQQVLTNNADPVTGKVGVYVDVYYNVDGESGTLYREIEPTLSAYTNLFETGDSEVYVSGVEIALIVKG